MSLFSWFSRKPAPSKSRSPVPAANAEPSGLMNADATVPLAPGARPLPLQQPPEHAANRKNERMERRELLYTVVRDAMVRAGVLSASYKFKVLSLDQRGRQFLVMMDLAREYGGETTRLSEIEALIAQTAKTRYDILVTAVYWRINDHVAVGIPLKGVAAAPGTPAAPAGAVRRPPAAAKPPVPVPAPAVDPNDPGAGILVGTPLKASSAPISRPAPLVANPATAPAPLAAPAAAAAKPGAQRFEPIEADEVAAFKRALADAASQRGAPATPVRPGVAVRSGPLLAPSNPTGFEDTEMPDSGHMPAPDLSSTQYGELN